MRRGLCVGSNWGKTVRAGEPWSSPGGNSRLGIPAGERLEARRAVSRGAGNGQVSERGSW